MNTFASRYLSKEELCFIQVKINSFAAKNFPYLSFIQGQRNFRGFRWQRATIPLENLHTNRVDAIFDALSEIRGSN